MKGIIFSADSVKGIIEGRKTQTRRRITPQPPESTRWLGWLLDSSVREGTKNIGDATWIKDGEFHFRTPRYEVGETVYVKESWCDLDSAIAFKQRDPTLPEGCKWKSSLFMPEKYSRSKLEITGSKVQRVQDITEEEAIAEGITYEMAFECNDWHPSQYDPDSGGEPNYVRAYATLWDSINGKKHPWESNPWVFAYMFKKVEGKS